MSVALSINVASQFQCQSALVHNGNGWFAYDEESAGNLHLLLAFSLRNPDGLLVNPKLVPELRDSSTRPPELSKFLYSVLVLGNLSHPQ